MEQIDILLPPAEAARRCGVSKRQLYRWEKDGRLARAIDLGEGGGTVRFRSEDIERIASEHQPRHHWPVEGN